MKKLFALLVPLLFIPSIGQAADPATEFKEGVSYQLIVPQQPTSDENKVEVVELFWYGCPHCFRFQPFMERWAKTRPDYVNYVRMPAILRDNWNLLAGAFYTAEALGIVDKIHRPLFDAIHKQRRHIDSEEDLMKFFGEFGVSNEDFKKTFHSFAVNSKVRRADLMTNRYHVHGTPSVVVNGKYIVDPGMAQNDFATMIKIIDFLIKKEHNNKG